MTTTPINLQLNKARSIDSEILIGKDILELLTGAMYVDPLCIFREYVQNSADSIDAVTSNDAAYTPTISIELDQSKRSIRIRDNGAGVSNNNFIQTLTAIGGSHKRGKSQRGFRGVGRLSGLGYCQELIFRSKALGDNKALELSWDGRKLKEILRDPHFTGDLSDVIKEIVKIRSYSDENNSPHFFEVELNKVGRLKNDLLLNEDEVRSYLAQVGPVPFHPEFELGEIIESKLTEFGNFRTYNITINDGRGSVYRPHQSEFSITENLKDQFTNVEFFEVLGQNGNPDAIGWMLNHSYYGAINKKYGLAGVRLRTGNIQVGSPEIAAHVFPETRFNSWAVGEVHVLTDKVLPNGRRDDFEYSVHYQNLLGQVSVIASSISKKCRDKSNARNRVKAARDFLTRCKSELGVASNEEFSVISRKLAIDKGEHLGHLARKVICSDLFVAGDKLELMDELETIEREARKIKEALNLESQEHKLNQEYFDIFGHIHDICRDSNEAHRIVEQLLTRLK